MSVIVFTKSSANVSYLSVIEKFMYPFFLTILKEVSNYIFQKRKACKKLESKSFKIILICGKNFKFRIKFIKILIQQTLEMAAVWQKLKIRWG